MLAGLPPGDVLASVAAPDGAILQPGQWIPLPAALSHCCSAGWYRAEYGDLPAVDLDWRDPTGASSVWPINSVAVDVNTVVLTGPRGQARLWRPPSHGCSYADVRWSADRAQRWQPDNPQPTPNHFPSDPAEPR